MIKYRRRKNIVEVELARVALHNAQRTLRSAIARAKTSAWQEMLATLERDLWGRPYRLVMQRLTSQSVALTEKFDLSTLDWVVRGLFPEDARAELPLNAHWDGNVEEENLVSQDEIRVAVRNIKRHNFAPGPDGITIDVMLSLLSAVPDRMLRCFNACISQSCFSECWKVARLILIRKLANFRDCHRPLCLLSEIGKLFERVLAHRIIRQVDGRGGFSPRQFGFCKSKSTCDANACLKNMATRSIHSGGVCVAVSLDVRNI